MKNYHSPIIILFSFCLLIISCQKSAEEYYNMATDAENYDPLLALEALNNAIDINPNYAVAYLERGRVKFKIHSYNSWNNEEIASNPLYKETLKDSLYLGVLNDYNIALKLDPKLEVDVRTKIGEVYLSLKKPQKAIEEYSKILTIDPTNKEATINAVMCNSLLNDTTSAFLLLEEMIENDPNNAESYYIRAIMNLGGKSGNKKPCEDLRKALELYDENVEYIHESIMQDWSLKESAKKLMQINCEK